MLFRSHICLICRVTDIKKLGSHHMFLAEVLAVHADEAYMDEKGRFDLNATGLMAYSHGEYRELGKKIGTFGYSVKKAGQSKSIHRKQKRRK